MGDSKQQKTRAQVTFEMYDEHIACMRLEANFAKIW
jgi:hypothetical protein